MLLKSPESKNCCVQPIRYTSSARAGLHAILNGIDFSEGAKLLLPAYIGLTDREGSGVFDPVQETGTPYEFYDLDHRLGAVQDNLYNLIKSEKFRALLVIHYFGFCQNDILGIAQLCKKHNVFLIEDCAHSMRSETPDGDLGMFGDFSIYSIHKFLAAQEGGYLRVNNSDFRHLLYSQPLDYPISDTLNILLSADLDAIREKRRNNYHMLLELITDYDGIEVMYPELPIGIAPYNLPIIIKNNQREAVYFNLINKGIPVIALYYRMITPIIEEHFAVSEFISDNILNLPVHQDIDESDLDIISHALRIATRI